MSLTKQFTLTDENGNSITIILTPTQANEIIKVLYPEPELRPISKGYFQLVCFFLGLNSHEESKKESVVS